MTRFRRALKQTIKRLHGLLDNLCGVPSNILSCGFCDEYSCKDCPIYWLCPTMHYQPQRLRLTTLEQVIMDLMYLHWLYDNKITERQMRQVNDG